MKLKVALIQQKCTESRDENWKKSTEMIKKAAKGGAKLVVLQEIHNTPYFCQSENVDFFDYAETIPGDSTKYFGKLAKKLEVVIVLSLFEKRAKGLYHNTAVVMEADGTIAGKYRKMHIPDDPGFYEKFYFTEGDMGFLPIKTSVGNLGVLVCWDQWYPEAARIMAMNGADILIYPTAIGWDRNDTKEEQERQKDAWIIAQRAHAVSNGLPVISVNRVGFEADTAGVTSGIDFWGHSFVAGPQGEFLALADHQNEVVLYADVDLDRTESVRRIWPFFRDRRIDYFDDLKKRWID